MTLVDRPVTAPPPPTWPTRTAFWWIALTALAVAVLAPLPHALTPLAELARDGQQVAANYAGRPPALQLAFALHVAFGGLALLLSPLQFAARLRPRAPAVHRGGRPGRRGLDRGGRGGRAGARAAESRRSGRHRGVRPAGGAVAGVRRRGRARDPPPGRRGAPAVEVRTFALTYAAVTLRLWLGALIAAQTALAGVPEQVAFDRAYLLVGVPGPGARPAGRRVVPGGRPTVPHGPAGHSRPMSEMDPRDPSTLYAEGPVAPEPPEDDLPDTSPLPDSGGTGPGPDDLDRLL